jgi:hypothetical protein
MKLEVRYMTEFGSQRQIMTLNELTRFIHKFHVIALYEVKEEIEIPEITNWDELPIVDSEDANGVSIRRNYLKENYPNGVIIKTQE